MTIRFHSDFISDLVSLGDAKFASRVLRKLFDKSGKFIELAQNDHRYDGIDDAWIRYVSQGGAALRVILIKSGELVTLYRVGPHAVEDNLVAPAGNEHVQVSEEQIKNALATMPGNRQLIAMRGDASAAFEELEQRPVVRTPNLLHNHIERFLYSNLLGRRFLPHKEVYLMAPYLSFDLLRPTDLFGQMLDDLLSGGAEVNLITKPPRTEEIPQFQQLSARGLSVFFCPDLHAKVYAFILNRDLLKPDQHAYKDFVAIGSANLTTAGFNPKGLLSSSTQFELSYDVPSEDWDDVENFLLHVAALSTELNVLRANLV